jgi:arylsulfatase A-like enzyme
VPLIFAGPGVTSDSRCAEPAELLDVYPTLSDLCQLEQPEGLEGHSLLPQLRDSSSTREWPAITTHNHDNHGIRSRDWRYIRYADGSEELYNMAQDPNEWTNLASRPEHAEIIAEHRRWIPKVNRKPVMGSRDRILLYDSATGLSNWEGKDILPADPIPELDH